MTLLIRGDSMKQLLAIAAASALVGCTGSKDVRPEATPAITESEQVKKEICEKTQCQKNVRVVLRKKDGTIYDRTFEVFPGIVQPIGITVLAGQTVNVEARIENGRLVYIKAVDAVVNPEKTIIAKFTQLENGGMMLSIRNPFASVLKFNMAIMPLDKKDLYKTSSCPVMAKGGSFESWPEPLFQVLLTNGRTLSAESGMSCVY